jgi:hypothetical protein
VNLSSGVSWLNAWMVKNAMVVDYGRTIEAAPRPPFFAPLQRTRFKTLLEIPEYTSIWLGRFIGSNAYSGRFRVRYHGLRGKHFGNQKSVCITFTVQEVALQMITLRRTRRKGPIYSTACDPALPWERYLISTWPDYDGLLWPPPLHLNDQTLEVLTNRWNRRNPVRIDS